MGVVARRRPAGSRTETQPWLRAFSRVHAGGSQKRVLTGHGTAQRQPSQDSRSRVKMYVSELSVGPTRTETSLGRSSPLSLAAFRAVCMEQAGKEGTREVMAVNREGYCLVGSCHARRAQQDRG